MLTHELIIRTMNAAKAAKEQGFDNTADAFDEIVESLLQLYRPRTQFESKTCTHRLLQSDHFN